MVKFGSIIFFFDLIFGIYLIISGLNLVDLSFLDSIKNWIILVGGILLIISGIISMNRYSTRYY